MIPFHDLTQIPLDLRNKWHEKVKRVIDSGVYIGGIQVESFESDFAEYLEAPYVVGVGNGLDALVLALRALDIGPGARVAVPAHTFIATWIAVIEVGAQPIAVDVDVRGQMDLCDLQEISEVDAVILVHMHGGYANIDEFCTWASERNIAIIEDCAQAHGAAYKGRKLGTWGDVGCFSFYPTKNLGALGDAGAVVVKDPNLHARLLEQRNYGASVDSKYRHVQLGKNSRLDAIQAAMLHESLRYLDEWNVRRRWIASEYLRALESNTSTKISALHSDPLSSVFHHFVILANNRVSTIDSLRKADIGFDIHYPNTAASEIAILTGISNRRHPVATKLSSQCISIPLNQWMTDDQVGAVADWLAEDKF
jgi:dTDP-4-amino-4,6-dideoxygalactose transaminase